MCTLFFTWRRSFSEVASISAVLTSSIRFASVKCKTIGTTKTANIINNRNANHIRAWHHSDSWHSRQQFMFNFLGIICSILGRLIAKDFTPIWFQFQNSRRAVFKHWTRLNGQLVGCQLSIIRIMWLSMWIVYCIYSLRAKLFSRAWLELIGTVHYGDDQ